MLLHFAHCFEAPHLCLFPKRHFCDICQEQLFFWVLRLTRYVSAQANSATHNMECDNFSEANTMPPSPSTSKEWGHLQGSVFKRLTHTPLPPTCLLNVFQSVSDLEEPPPPLSCVLCSTCLFSATLSFSPFSLPCPHSYSQVTSPSLCFRRRRLSAVACSPAASSEPWCPPPKLQ